MKEKKIKVLNIANNTNMGGQQKVYMDILRNIDKNKFKVDLAVYDENKNKGFFEDEIKKLGVELYKIPSISKHPIKHIKELKKVIKDGEYEIIHQHTDTAMIFINLIIAKICKVKKTIVHSHSSRTRNELLHKISKKTLNKFTDCKIACSDLAGKWMYGKNVNYKIIKNAVDFNKFMFNIEYRREIRNELNIKDNQIVLGNIARFSIEKNQEFLINVINEFKENQKYVLILVGDGPEKNKIEEMIENLNLKDRVKLLGIRQDNYKIIQAIDIFLLPSLFEGLPITAIEAQVSGCNCIISDNITDEVVINNTCKEKLKPDMWKKLIEKMQIVENEERKIDLNDKKFREFNIKYFIKEIEKIYDNT